MVTLELKSDEKPQVFAEVEKYIGANGLTVQTKDASRPWGHNFGAKRWAHAGFGGGAAWFSAAPGMGTAILRQSPSSWALTHARRPRGLPIGRESKIIRRTKTSP